MEKQYKKLMNSKKTVVARFIDTLFILLLTTIIVFGFCIVKLANITSTIIIVVNINLIMLLLMGKMHNMQIVKFKKTIDAKIKNKLILERIVFSKGKNISIMGYKHIMGREYVNDEGEPALLLPVYPQSVLTPKEILEHITDRHKELIASCTFDEDCYLLCSRLGIRLKDKEFLLKNTNMCIDDEQIKREIEAEVKEINEIRKKKKSTAFSKERWSKYLISCLLLFAVSNLMGRFKIIYIAFAGMCMSFCFISLFASKPQ